jgi:hypothetical protein
MLIFQASPARISIEELLAFGPGSRKLNHGKQIARSNLVGCSVLASANKMEWQAIPFTPYRLRSRLYPDCSAR